MSGEGGVACDRGGKYLKELEIDSKSANSYRQLKQRNHQKVWSCVQNTFREKKRKRRVERKEGGRKRGEERRKEGEEGVKEKEGKGGEERRRDRWKKS